MSIEIYDTTLRDGAQGVGINFSVSDKLRIAEHLDTLGVTVVEGGWPGANPTDTEFFAAMRTRPLRNATLAAFGATRRAGVRPQDDPQLRTLLDSMAPMVTLVGKTWDLQVIDVLRTTTAENLAMIAELRALARSVKDGASCSTRSTSSTGTPAIRSTSCGASMPR